MPTPTTPPGSESLFRELGLSDPVLRALADVGYETPTPIQEATIPRLLAGEDLLGQAQTGTGKTAAFALPILSKIVRIATKPQALVLTPTRELAIQVAEAFQRYAAHLPGFHVLPIYGGAAYAGQLSGLRRGVHVIVGTPGRVIDHLQRGSLDLSGITTLILDEADEMLRMGFLDDVEAILQKTPSGRQTALFSATMPAPIRRIANEHLKNPSEVTIRGKTQTATNINQRYWMVSGIHKLDALTRILEAEPFEAMIVFARTKIAVAELAEKVEARGFAAAPIHGDMVQAQRERTIQRLKEGQLDILVATDVAARGLDVDRITHIINYDIPHDVESYIHRIGRTGRAGRSGEAILFVTPRERHLLKSIERATRQPLLPMELPSVEAVNSRRVEKFYRRITETLEAGGLDDFQSLVERYERDHDVPALELAAALAKLVQGDEPLFLRASRPKFEGPKHETPKYDGPPRERSTSYPTGERSASPRPPRAAPFEKREGSPSASGPKTGRTGAAMAVFRVEVGNQHGVKPGNLVGAIANEAGLESRHIGRIDIRDDHTLIELPSALSTASIRHLQNVRVAGQRLQIRRSAR